MRITLAKGVGIWQVESAEQFERPSLGLGSSHQTMLDGHFADLIDQTMCGIERGGGALRNIGDALTTHFAPVICRKVSDTVAINLDAPPGDPASGARIYHRGQTNGRFSCAAFANQAEDFAALEFERNIIHDDQARKRLDAEIVKFEDRIRHVPTSPPKRRRGGN